MNYDDQDHDFLHAESILQLVLLFWQNFHIPFYHVSFQESGDTPLQHLFKGYDHLRRWFLRVQNWKTLMNVDGRSSLSKFLLTTCTFLFRLSLRLPGNFETKVQSVSGVSRVFKSLLLENVLHFNTKIRNFLKDNFFLLYVLLLNLSFFTPWARSLVMQQLAYHLRIALVFSAFDCS